MQNYKMKILHNGMGVKLTCLKPSDALSEYQQVKKVTKLQQEFDIIMSMLS